ncbi:hypothetical protein CspHIS471_0608260 [Cutaneotrichosporon sp. HIS471]|nr:hypothetical protein CspHIS471_0608260 [Cutaneotrichosporon sp. HIS471]
MLCTQSSSNTLSEPEYSSVSSSSLASTFDRIHPQTTPSSPAFHYQIELNAHALDPEDSQWPGRAPLGSLSQSARQPPPDFPPRRVVSAASLTPAHTPIVTPSHERSSLPATSSTSSSASSLRSTTTSTSTSTSASYSSGLSSLQFPMSRIPQVGHAPVSAALHAQALEAMYERPSERTSSASPPPEGAGAGSGYGSAGPTNNGVSSRRAGASHRRRSHGHGPMRTPARPHTPAMSHHGGPTPPTRKSGANAGAGMYNQPTRAFVLERLHEYASAALSNPRTSDVRIVVPSRPKRQDQPPESRRGTHPPTPESASVSDPQSGQVTPNGAAPAPAAAQAQATVPVRFYALHRDYLMPQSALFRAILTGGFKDGSPEAKGCKLLPYTSLHGPRPVFVPLPDPDSFDALVHWLYFGDVAKLESQLSSGEVNWRGLIRNIQYLGCDDRTRAVVAKWWQRWAQSDRRIGRPKQDKKNKEEDSDDEHAEGVPVPRRREPRPVVDDEDDDDERESSYDNVDDKLSSPWRSSDNLSYSVDADEMTRRLGGL